VNFLKSDKHSCFLKERSYLTFSVNVFSKDSSLWNLLILIPARTSIRSGLPVQFPEFIFFGGGGSNGTKA
jgi:hypothetical protein